MARGKVHWWVMTATDGVYSRLYSGPDRSKAREAAARQLRSADGKGGVKGMQVLVLRVTAQTALTGETLRAVLPKDAF